MPSAANSKIEKLVEEHWATVRLGPELRDALEDGLRSELAGRRKDAADTHRLLSTERAKLSAQRQKPVEAIYSSAMSMDLIAGEQERIASQLAALEGRLGAATAESATIETNLAAALDLARDCHAAYVAAGPQLRRLFNQAFFTHLMIDEEGDVQSAYADPFDVLLDDAVLDAGRAVQADRDTGFVTMADVLSSAPNRDDTQKTKKTPRALRAAGGLTWEPSAPVAGGEGSNITTLAPPAGLVPAAKRLEGARSVPCRRQPGGALVAPPPCDAGVC